MPGRETAMTGKKSAAILVDADDIPQNTLEVIHSALSSCCDVRVLRVFGNSSRLSDAGWTALSARLPLDFRMTPNNSPGKSSASLALALDAMDLLFTSDAELFCLCSVESDFSRLARKLRGYGRQVIGIGERCSCHAFRASCGGFLNLSDLVKDQGAILAYITGGSGVPRCAEPAKPQEEGSGTVSGGEHSGDAAPEITRNTRPDSAHGELKGEESQSPSVQNDSVAAGGGTENANTGILTRSELEGVILKAVRALSLKKQGNVSLSDLAQLLKKEIPGFSVSSFGYGKLKTLVKSFSSLKVFGNASNLYVAIAEGHGQDQQAAGASELERLIRGVYLQLCIRHNNRNITTSDLCNAIVMEKPGFSSKKYGFSKFRNLLKSLEFVEVVPQKGKPPLVRVEGS